MRPNLNKQGGTNILTLFKNDITYCDIISIIVTFIVFDFIYSKFSERYFQHLLSR